MERQESTVDLNRQLEAYSAVAKLPEQHARRRWANWSIYAAATGAALAGASAASAEIIYSGPQDLTARDTIFPGRNFNSLRVDLDGKNDTFDFGINFILNPRLTVGSSASAKFAGVGRTGGVFERIYGTAKFFRPGALISGTRGLQPQVKLFSSLHRTNAFCPPMCTMSTLRRGTSIRSPQFLGVEFNGKTSHGGPVLESLAGYEWWPPVSP
jgi:hypothetical protein